MRSEPEELVRAFLRKWSTLNISEVSRPLLKHDVMHLRTMLEIHEYEVDFLVDAEHAPDREWFAKKHRVLFLN